MKQMVKRCLALFLVMAVCLSVNGLGVFAQEVVVNEGTIGLNFGSQNAVLCGEKISGSVSASGIGSFDAVNLSITYDAAVFSNLDVEAAAGVTLLASEKNDNQVTSVVMVDPEKADYSNLLKVTATAGGQEGTGRISITASEAAMAGEAVSVMPADEGTEISVLSDALIEEFNIQTLSKAMTYFMVDSTSQDWAKAAKYDLQQDEIINIKDFVKIANAILDAQRIGKLTFNEDGKFKVMQMSDIQDYVNSTTKKTLDQKTVNLINAALDSEKPDLVVINGDQIGGNMTANNLKSLIDQIAAPFEERKIPWLVTFGNHDEDATLALNEGWNKIQQLAYYRSFPHNINRASMSGMQGLDSNGKNTHAVGDMYQLIYDKEGKNPVYNIWALDSNRYEDSGKAIGGYDWIRPGQVQWYSKTSSILEAKYGKKINSLMFFHIPLPEWGIMWANKAKFGVVGEKNENECPSGVNSGMFAAAMERKDVKGMFVGHDHANDYAGNYYGIWLGYDANVGYQTYGLGGDQNDRIRGVRVFEIDQSNTETFTTKMVRASDLGVNQ